MRPEPRSLSEDRRRQPAERAVHESRILLEEHQERLLTDLAVASRTVRQEKFRVHNPYDPTSSGGHLILHPGFEGGRFEAYFGDVELLANQGLLQLMIVDAAQQLRKVGSQATPKIALFDVAPAGLLYVAELERLQ